MLSTPFSLMAGTFEQQKTASMQSFESLYPARYVAFGRFAHQVLEWFYRFKELESVKLVAVATAQADAMASEVTVRHHFNIVTAGVPALVPDSSAFALDVLPWQRMGNGAFTVQRDHPVVLKALSLSPDSLLEYKSVVITLSLHLDAAFNDFTVTHDIGVSSVGS